MMLSNNRFLTKRKLIMSSIVFVILITVYLFFELQFHIINTNPSLGSVTNLTPFVKVNFNKKLSKNDIVLTANPASAMQSYEIDGKTLTIKLAYPLIAMNKYSLNLQSITAEDGSKIVDKTFDFTVITGEYNKLPEDQKKALNQAQLPGPANTIDPILSHIPYSTLDYRIDPLIDEQNNLKLHIQILLAPSDTTTQADLYKQEALTYIKSFNLDPTKYTIEYETVRETLEGR